MAREKRDLVSQRLAELAKLLPSDATIRKLGDWHYRIEGPDLLTVDYWPSKNKYWITGNTDDMKGKKGSPAEVAKIAISGYSDSPLKLVV